MSTAANTTAKPRLKTSAMIASIAAEGQRTKPAPFGHALVELAQQRVDRWRQGLAPPLPLAARLLVQHDISAGAGQQKSSDCPGWSATDDRDVAPPHCSHECLSAASPANIARRGLGIMCVSSHWDPANAHTLSEGAIGWTQTARPSLRE